jgi:hypothetical protein
MAITVRADVKDGEQGVTATQEIRPLLNDMHRSRCKPSVASYLITRHKVHEVLR